MIAIDMNKSAKSFRYGSMNIPCDTLNVGCMVKAFKALSKLEHAKLIFRRLEISD